MTSRRHASLARSALFVALPCFLAGLLLMQVFLHRETLLILTFDSYKARYQVMTSAQSGPERYYVFHDPRISLDDLARTDPAVVGFAKTPLRGLTTVDLSPGNPASIEHIRARDGVRYAIRSNIPMYCH